ncbi:MAG: RCC1 domain-containing protein, partial [Deltaproteobacteria bacterium]
GGASCPPPLRGNLMSLSSTHACAGIFGGTRLQCWGDRRGFSEGDGLVSSPDDIDIAENLAPLRETVDPSSLGLSAFDTGGQMTCVVNLDGRVSCFGASAPEAGTVFVHDVDNDALDARELAVGDGFACVVARVDPPQVFCWGENGSSQTGRPGPNAGRAFPVAVPGGGTPQDVAAGRAHACSLAGGEIYCWGDNSNGQVSASAGAGPAPPTRVTVPTDGAVLPVMPWVAVDAGGDRTCAIDTASRLWCWGGPRGTPAGCLGCSFDIGFRDVSVGETHLCGRNTRGDTVCLGLGPGDRPSPLDGVARAIAGNGVTCGTRTGDSQAAIVCETATDAVGVVDSALLEALLGRGHTTEGRDVVCP